MSWSGLQGPGEALDAKLAVSAFYAILEKMPEEQREVFVLHDLEQMKGREIAEITDTNENTVHIDGCAPRDVHLPGRRRAPERKGPAVSDDEMTPEAWRLLDVVRQAESPSELEMRRMRRAIAVGVGATLAAPVAKAATSAVTSKGAVAVTAAKSAAFLTARSRARRRSRCSPPSARGPSGFRGTITSGRRRRSWRRPRFDQPSRPPPRVAPPSTLLGELTLLQRAQRALAGGAPGVALSLASEHATRYPSSQLSRERDAVRVFSYCALGRTAEARALAAEILKSAPRSPVRASLEQSCAAPLPELASPALLER